MQPVRRHKLDLSFGVVGVEKGGGGQIHVYSHVLHLSVVSAPAIACLSQHARGPLRPSQRKLCDVRIAIPT